MAELTPEAVNLLSEGIALLLGRWYALQNEPEKAQQLTVNIYQWLIRPSEALYVDELEDLLDDFMLSFNTDIDDGSVEEIADSLMIMHKECLEGNFASIVRLRQPVPTFNQRIQEQGGQFGNKDLGLSDDFISDHGKVIIFISSKSSPADEEPNFCVICQMDFEDQERIRVLDCHHEYHVECISCE
ncbi:pre-rRNA-processing protein TSR2 homolog isoform X2 [Helianthus annuus]|uniref:pre-rRNA-processing protein TSR2 homolog isoform X2 n=1 Tax=Helianthus annuus TaxID=4232 RepID=UPI000B904A36|nr:pre-rRNA-processing protein TSR2 homolog isoform X2 [Helianthus annuus]